MEFKDLNLKEMDRNLSEEEQTEWNAIYASYRAGSMLTGNISGMDTVEIRLKNEETGEFETKAVNCLVIINYRVKILIPEQYVWFSEETLRPEHVLRSMLGAEVDYVIIGIDRENGCCTASRREALYIRRRTFLRKIPKPGDKLTVDILAVGYGRLLASCGGFDMTLSQSNISYGVLGDLRLKYHTGEKLIAVLKEYKEEKQKLYISVKDAKPHPFNGVEIRYPLNCRRASTISGKYKGGVFCKLEDELDCLCIYSPYQCDEDFKIGDQVIVAITKYDFDRKLVYGKIVAKW